jgi:hypothetical protein
VGLVDDGVWAIKIVATTLGEVGGNAVTLTLGLGYLAGTAIFAGSTCPGRSVGCIGLPWESEGWLTRCGSGR